MHTTQYQVSTLRDGTTTVLSGSKAHRTHSTPSSKRKQKQRRVVSGGLGVVYDPRMCMHEDPVDPTHPEQPARVAAVFEELLSKVCGSVMW